MHRYHPAWKSRSNHFFVAVLASSAILTAGCANMASTAVDSDSLPGTAAMVTGHVHGGSQPISNATVTVNFVGSTGVGSAGSVVATTTTSIDGFASFSFIKDPNNGASHPSTGNEYSCPAASNSDPLVYIMAKGGNTQNSGSAASNPAIVFLAPLGRCKEINTATFLNITEVTTVATIAALQQYIDPQLENIGADGTGVAYQAITNSFNLISSLVNVSTGTAVTSTTFAGGGINFSDGVSTASVTATPEAAKINTIANIIAVCVNSTGPTTPPTPPNNCNTLFSNATPPAYSVTARPYNGNVPFSNATDVLQATYFMFTNPSNGSTTNLSNLYNLPVGVGTPFQPALTAVPNDWTIGISYSSSSNCGKPVVPPATYPGLLISSPASLSIDTNGNVWFANGQTGIGNLTELNATGTPVVCHALNGNLASTSTVSTTIDNPTAGGFNVWQGSSDSLTITRYTQANPVATLNFTATEAPIALAADGVGNVYFSTALGNLWQIPNGAGVTTAVAPVKIASNVGYVPTGIFVDSTPTVFTAVPPATGTTQQTGAIWMTSGTGKISRTVPTLTVSDPGYMNGFSTTPFNSPAPTYGITVTGIQGGLNNVLLSLPDGSNSVTNFSGSGTSYSQVNTWPALGLAGLNTPLGIAIDGRANIWTANNTNNGNSTTGFFGSVSEISAAKAALSPATGFQKDTTLLNSSRSVVIDQSGNVWVAGDGNGFVTELVGAAVPVFQPYANGLAAGRFQTIP